MTIKLAFFLSRATPLSRWAKMGVFERETAVYRHLQIDNLSIITSGGKEELAFQEQLPGIEILYNRWGLSANVYSLLAPILHYRALRNATIYKTNQLDGAWTAVLAAKLHRKPVIVRAGYLWGNNFTRQQGDGRKAAMIRRLERFSFTQANRVVVTTQAMATFVAETYRIAANKITIIPNYVDTALFCPDPSIKKVKGRLCFVGRLTAVKNLDLLIEAIAPLSDVSLVLIGEGEQHSALEKLAKRLQVDARFLGRVENRQLPVEINQAEIFVLPSKFEGHPKALIEAMGCETAVIGTDVEGINTVIHHNETGVLCAPTTEAMRHAIQELLADAERRAELGKNGRQFTLQHFALNTIIFHEKECYQATITDYERAH